MVDFDAGCVVGVQLSERPSINNTQSAALRAAAGAERLASRGILR